MKMRIFTAVSHILILTGLLITLFASQPIVPAQAAGMPVEQLLNPDGTLNLSTGFSGPLNTNNYGIRLDPLRGPVFSPLMTLNAWDGLGGGLNNIVYAIAINGSNVYVGGQFTDAGGDSEADGIAKWNGSSWSALGNGIDEGQQVNALAFHGSNLYVGGNFTNAGGVSGADYIAQWNGTTWSTLGTALGAPVYAIAVSGSNVYVGGQFTNVESNSAADYIVKLDGGNWDSLGTFPVNGAVNAIAISGSTVYVGGDFTSIQSSPIYGHIAYWDSTNSLWNPLTNGLDGSVSSIVLFQGNVYAAGFFNGTNGGGDIGDGHIGMWDGTIWHGLDTGLNSYVSTITVAGTNLYAGGNFTDAGMNTNADYIARWDGAGWSALGATPLDNGTVVTALAANGLDLYAGGTFENAVGDPDIDKIALFELDGTAPSISDFSTPAYSTSLNVTIGTFDASDNVGVTGYKVTESATTPLLTDSGWTSSPTATYTVAADGSYTLYPWVRDVHGNISATYGWPVTVNVDATAPMVDSFSAPSSATSLTLSGITFTASDSVGVTGYMITESNTPPSAGASGWEGSAPTSFNLSSYGNYSLYPWARDQAGNVSAVYATPATGTACFNGNTTVTTNADNGIGSLRRSIEGTCAGNTIDFDSALSGDTIILGTTVVISKNITIDGSALASPVTISGDTNDDGPGNNVRVFYVSSGATVTLDSLHVTEGSANDLGGGGGLINNGTLLVKNSIFSANSLDNYDGGAILNSTTGALTIADSTFYDNTAYNGGAIGNYNQLTVTDSTFYDNTVAGSGGAIYTTDPVVYNPTVTMTIANSTFAGNTANVGGGVSSSRTQTITNSTFSGNTTTLGDGGAIWQDSETLNIANNIIANSIGGSDCNTIQNNGIKLNNLVEDANSNCAGGIGAINGVDPNLGALADNGGPTQTMALAGNSPAINAGANSTCNALPVNNLDQRGVTRPNGPSCDIGAYEYEDTTTPTISAFVAPSPSSSLNISIPTFLATDDVGVSGYLITESSTIPLAGAVGWTNPALMTYTVSGPGTYTLYPWAKDAFGHVTTPYGSPVTVTVCLPSPVTVTSSADSGVGTLRYALTHTCDNSIINFDNSLSGATVYLASTLTISKNYTIDGSTLTEHLTLSGDSNNDGDGDVRVFSINSGLNVALDNLTITKGRAYGNNPNDPHDPTGQGGAIRAESPLTITNSTFTQNSSTGDGGAIFSNAPLTIIDSTFAENSITTANLAYGGAVSSDGVANVINSTFYNNSNNNGFAGALFASSTGSSISNSTFYGNVASTGGAILSNGDQFTITNTTISGNSAADYGGIAVIGLSATLSNTIIANSTGGDCGYDQNFTDVVINSTLIEDGFCEEVLGGPNVPASLSGDPNLGPLADNGGLTMTMALPASSPAIDAGNDAICAAYPVLNNDQRGMTRPNSAHCDIGAYEYQDTTAPTVTAFTATSPSKTLSISIPDFDASDIVNLAGYIITESSTPPSAGAASWTSSPPLTYTVSGDGSYTLYPWAKDAQGNISAAFGSPASVIVDTTLPTVVSSIRAGTSPTNAASVNFVVTFSEPVFNVDTDDFSLTTTGNVNNASVTNVSGSGTTRTVSVNTGSKNGSIRLNILANGGIQDIAGNPLTGQFDTGETYTIDKTVTLILKSVPTQDGWILETTETSSRGGPRNLGATTIQLGDSATNQQYLGILSFKTAPIPDNITIASVTLKVRRQSITGIGNPLTIFRGFMVDIRRGHFGTSALEATDFQALASKTYGPFSPALVSNWYSIDLTSGKAYINKLSTNSGLTQIRLRFAGEDNNNELANYLSIYSGNGPDANDPQLVIKYVP